MKRYLRVVLMGLLLVAAVLGCGGSSPVSVIYEVTGSVPFADIWYDNSTIVSLTYGNPLPWSRSYTSTGNTGEQLFLAAYASHLSGYVTVTIYVNGSASQTATNAPGGAFYGQDKAEVTVTL